MQCQKTSQLHAIFEKYTKTEYVPGGGIRGGGPLWFGGILGGLSPSGPPGGPIGGNGIGGGGIGPGGP